MNSPKDPSAIVVPFGKHKGSTVAELLAKDPGYADWLLAQGWLAERFAELHAAMLTRGAGSDDTPEHNAIQGRFLDPLFRAAYVRAAHGWRAVEKHLDHCWNIIAENALSVNDRYNRLWTDAHWMLTAEQHARRDRLIAEKRKEIPEPSFCTSARFEIRGIDVLFCWGFYENPKGAEREIDSDVNSFQYENKWTYSETIEIKPSLGEDYPSVMRQMQRLGANYLIVDLYTGRALPFESVRGMFKANKLKVVTVQEIESELANARAWLEPPSSAL